MDFSTKRYLVELTKAPRLENNTAKPLITSQELLSYMIN